MLSPLTLADAPTQSSQDLATLLSVVHNPVLAPHDMRFFGRHEPLKVVHIDTLCHTTALTNVEFSAIAVVIGHSSRTHIWGIEGVMLPTLRCYH